MDALCFESSGIIWLYLTLLCVPRVASEVRVILALVPRGTP